MKPGKGTVRKPGAMRGTKPKPDHWLVEVGPAGNGGDWLHIQIRTKNQFSSMAFVTRKDGGLEVHRNKSITGGLDVFSLVASMPTHITVNLVGTVELRDPQKLLVT